MWVCGIARILGVGMGMGDSERFLVGIKQKVTPNTVRLLVGYFHHDNGGRCGLGTRQRSCSLARGR
jgi:hypothetical protein